MSEYVFSGAEYLKKTQDQGHARAQGIQADAPTTDFRPTPSLAQASMGRASQYKPPAEPTSVAFSGSGEPSLSGLSHNPNRFGDDASWAERYVTAPFGRGVDRFQALASLGLGDTEEYAEQQRQILAGTQLTAEDQAIMERIHTTGSFWEAIKLYAQNPRLAAALTAESLGLFGPTLVTAGAVSLLPGVGLPAVAAVIASGSFGTEYLATIDSKIQERGVNPQDVEQVNALLADTAFMRDARSEGLKRGISVGAWDALSVGLAGKITGSITRSIGAKRDAGKVVTPGSARAQHIGGATGEMAVQMGTGGAGEATAQFVVDGKITSPGDVVSEAVGEFLPGAGTIGVAALARRDRTAQKKPAAGEDAPPSTLSEADADAIIAQVSAAVAAKKATDDAAPEQAEMFPELGEGGQQTTPEQAEMFPDDPVDPRQLELDFPQVSAKKEDNAEAWASDEDSAAEMEEALKALSRAHSEKETSQPQAPKDTMLSWLAAQTEAKDGKKRAATMYRDTNGTKRTGSALLKRRLVVLGEAIQKRLGVKLPEPPPMKAGQGAFAQYFEALHEGLKTRRPEMAKALSRALQDNNPGSMMAVFDGVLDILNGAQDIHPMLIGTPFEPALSQYRRGRAEADRIMAGPKTKTGKPVLARTTGEFASVISNMRASVARLLHQRAKDKLKVTSAEWDKITNALDDGEPMPPDLMQKWSSLGKVFVDGFEVIIRARGVFSSGSDVAAIKGQSIYAELDALGKSLEKAGKIRQSRDQRMMDKVVISNSFQPTRTRADDLKESAKTKKQLLAQRTSLVNQYLDANTTTNRKGWLNQLAPVLVDTGMTLQESTTFINKLITDRKKLLKARTADSARRAKQHRATRQIEKAADMKTVATDEFGKGSQEVMAFNEETQELETELETKAERTEKLAEKREDAAIRRAAETGRIDSRTSAIAAAGRNKHIRNAVVAASDAAAGSVASKKDTKPSTTRKWQGAEAERKLREARAVEKKLAKEADKRKKAAEKTAEAERKARPTPKTTKELIPAEKPAQVVPQQRTETPTNLLIALGINTTRFPMGVYMDALLASIPQLVRSQTWTRFTGSLYDLSGEQVSAAADPFARSGNMRFSKEEAGAGFFGTMNEPGSDSAVVAGFRAALTPENLVTFDALVDAFATAYATGSERGVVQLGRNRAPVEAERVNDAMTRLMQFVREQGIAVDFVGLKDLKTQRAKLAPTLAGVSNFAVALRDLTQAALLRGDMILDSQAANDAYFAALQRELKKPFVGLLDRISNNDTPVGLQRLLRRLSGALPTTHWLQPVVTQLLKTGINMDVVWADIINNKPGVIGNYSYPTSLRRDSRLTNTPRLGLRQITIKKGDAGQMMAALIHEAVHAATVLAYHNDPKLKLFMDNIHDEVVMTAWDRSRDGDPNVKDLYGIKDPLEMIAEAFSNPEFQQFLRTVDTTHIGLWDRFKSLVRRILALPPSVTALDSIMSARVDLFQSQATLEGYAAETNLLLINDPGELRRLRKIRRARGDPPLTSVNRENTSLYRENTEGTAAGVKQALSDIQVQIDLTNRLTSTWGSIHLGAMNLDFMERKFRDLFDKYTPQNWMTLYRNANTRVTKMARGLTKDFMVLAEKTSAIPEQDRTKLFNTMIKATMAGVHVDAGKDVVATLADQSNAHLFYKKDNAKTGAKKGDLIDKAAVIDALQAWQELNDASPAAAALYGEHRVLLQKAYNGRRGALMKYALEMRGNTGLTPDQIEAISEFTSSEEFDAYIKKENPQLKDDAGALIREIFSVTKIQGPYFPLRREGNYVVEVADDANPYFALFKTQALADADALKHPGAVVTPLIQASSTRGLNDAVRALLSKISPPDQLSDDGNGSIRSQLNNAATRMLADNILYSSQLKRKGIAGVQPGDMAKSLEDYVRSSISAIGSLDAAYDVDQALKNMAVLQRDPNVEPADRNTIARVRNELLKRAKEVATDRDVTSIDRILGSLGFFTYLGAPSYWILNATQTAVVGVPVLAGMADVGYTRASRAMGNAYKNLTQITKGKGWKALDNLDDVLASLTADQAKIVQQLIDDNVLQATLSHEFGLLNRSNVGLYNKVTGFLQKVPEMIERWNRLSMALAAMELGITDYVKIRDVTETSQFNYDTANRARLLKTAPTMLGGGARKFISPIMMFKVFAFGMAELIYGNFYDAFLNQAKSDVQKREARRILTGILASHTLAGGVFGGLSPGMGQIVLTVVNSLLDDEDKFDPEQILDEFLTAHTNDYVARLVTRGIPAAVGADLSASINVGSLVWMSRDNDWAEFGGIEQSVYGLLGPVAQYIGGGVREASRLVAGEATVADFAEKAVPLKWAKALMQTYRYGAEGLETRQGQTFMEAEEIGIGALALTSLGLRSAIVSQRQAKFYADRKYSRVLEGRKSEIMAKIINANTASERNRAHRDKREWNAKMREMGNRALVIKDKNTRASAKAQERIARQYRAGDYTLYNR